MSKFLFVTGIADGHVNPCIPIVKKLIDRGHEVAWLNGRNYQEKIEGISAKFYPYPKYFDPQDIEVYDFWPELGKRKGLNQLKYYIKHIFLDYSEAIVDTMKAIMRKFPANVIVGDNITFGAYFYCELEGKPCAMISLLPLPISSKDIAPYGLGLTPGQSMITKVRNRTLTFLFDHIFIHDIKSHMNRIRRRLGLPNYNKPFLDFFTFPSLLLQLSTPAFEYPRTDLPGNIKFTGPILQEPTKNYVKPIWWNDLEKDQKVVLVNQGTIAKNLNDLIIPTIQGLAEENLLVVTVPVANNEIDALPSNVRAENYIPFDQILPHVDVMITNGGYGGTQMALAHGIPLVLAGATDDKMEVSARVEWAGAGINLRKSKPSPAEIRHAVKEVLSSPQFKAGAEEIQRDFQKYQAPIIASELLESLVPA